MSYPERIVPDETEPGVVALHLKRYEFARGFAEGRDVLDAACGAGYGTAYLAERARRVVGADVSDEALAYARSRYGSANVEFVRQDLQELDVPAGSFDVVVSFETIEHLERPEAFIERAAQALRPGGVFVASTPHVDRTTRNPANPHHRVELSAADLEGLLHRHFASVELYGQRRVETLRHRALRRLDVFGLRRRLPALRRAGRLTGTAPTESVGLEGIEIVPGTLDRATELVAVCRT